MWNRSITESFRAWWEPLRARAHEVLLPPLPLSAEAFLAWSLHQASGQTVLWIGDGPRALDTVRRDLETLAPPRAVPLLVFPPPEFLPDSRGRREAVNATEGERLATLSALRAGRPVVLATCIQALLEPVLPPAALTAGTLTLRAGAAQDIESILHAVEQAGGRIVPAVQARGEAAVRGGLLDLWPVSEPWPLRLEFLGDTLESLRTFDPDTQRSLEKRETIQLSLLPAATRTAGEPSAAASLLDYLQGSAAFLWSDLAAIESHAGLHAETAEAERRSLRLSFAALRGQAAARPDTFQVYTGTGPATLETPVPLDLEPVPAVVNINAPAPMTPDLLEAARRRFLGELADRAHHGHAVRLFFDTEGAHRRFLETCGPTDPWRTLPATVQPLSQGFTSAAWRLTAVAESDLYGRRIRRRRPWSARPAGPGQEAGLRLSDWTDMEPGDLVVHLEHGIGRYLGLREITVSGILQEGLAIEYAEGAKLYVPVSHAHLLTRYAGVGRTAATLHRLGGARWGREKQEAERAVQDLAAQLLETQASRETLPGHACAPDTPWQHELEAAFPYEETPDQERAVREVKRDMEQSRPMDRLICGDAGYGKTEVAMRAAFKAVSDGRQVAVLVPTTVLAQQHYETFRERMAAFPVRIDMLSRFCSGAQAVDTVHGLQDGTVDIVIGTHALLQPGIRFRELGLVIIDEEQRFGVLHKERFKHIRRLVDVLTLTATPIPRTLYLSMTGARDLSTIQTPPQERLAVETLIVRDTDALLREAILREINREGQVYFLHNRILTIERVRARLAALVPEARIEVAHGRMPASALADTMHRFAVGEFDVLLCTTIVESGMDIPNANTIFIDRADRFGLAELYQLRGRVGRSRRKGYAYMLLPGEAAVDPTARQRIQAIARHSDLGAGFRLAMRDLEIRGAGNLLGAEQSGHITAVGFGLYCQLLRRTIARHKGEAPPPVVDVELRLDFMDFSPLAAGGPNSAILPATYVEDERMRVGLYRRIAEAARREEIAALQEEFRDRFGPVPPAVQRLLRIAEIRIVAAVRTIAQIETREERILCQRDGQHLLRDGRLPRFRRQSPDAKLEELLTLVQKV